MIPPCDPAILKNNPDFQRLHEHLTKSLLNPDGTSNGTHTTVGGQSTDSGSDLEDEFKACLIKYARKLVIKRAIRAVAFDRANNLSVSLRNNVAVIALYLLHERSLTEDELLILQPDIDTFCENLPSLAPHISTYLSTSIDDLRAVVRDEVPPDAESRTASRKPASSRQWKHPARGQSVQKKQVDKLPNIRLSTLLRDRQTNLRNLQLCELPAIQEKTAVTAANVLAARAKLMEQIIVLLERTKHGALARATRVQAEHLAMVAEGVDAKVRVMKLETLASIYTPETITALKNYQTHLQDVRLRLEERLQLAVRTLEDYEWANSGKKDDDKCETGCDGETSKDHYQRIRREGLSSGPLVDIARRYGALIKQVEDVEREIKRLG